MKLKQNLTLRKVAGEYMIINTEVDANAITNVFSLNETAAFLWEQFKDAGSFTIDDMLNSLAKEYEIEDQNTTLKDLEELLGEWSKIGFIEE